MKSGIENATVVVVEVVAGTTGARVDVVAGDGAVVPMVVGPARVVVVSALSPHAAARTSRNARNILTGVAIPQAY